MKISGLSKSITSVFLLFIIIYYSESAYSLPPICAVSNNVLTIDGSNVDVKSTSASESQSSTSTSISSASSSNLPELDRAQADKISYQLATIKSKPILRIKICNWIVNDLNVLLEILSEILDGVATAAEVSEIEINYDVFFSSSSLEMMGYDICKLLQQIGFVTRCEKVGDSLVVRCKRYIYLRNNTLIIDGSGLSGFAASAEELIGGINVFLSRQISDQGTLSLELKERIRLFASAFQITGIELRNLRLGRRLPQLLKTLFTGFGANLSSVSIHNVEIADGVVSAIIDSIGAVRERLTTVRYFGNDANRESDHLMIIRALCQRASLHTLDVSQNIVSGSLVELLREIMSLNTAMVQVYLSRNAVTESGGMELLRFCMEPASSVLNFIDADIGEFASINTPRVDAILRVMQERNFAIQRFVADLMEDFPDFCEKFFKSKAELVAAILRESGDLSTLPAESEVLGRENHKLIAVIRECQSRLRSVLNQLNPDGEKGKEKKDGDRSSQNECCPGSLAIERQSMLFSSSLSASSSIFGQNDTLPSINIDDNNILLIDGHNSGMSDGVQASQIIYSLSSIGPRPILGVRIQNLTFVKGDYLIKILHALLDNESVVSELSTIDIRCVIWPLNNHRSRTAVYELLQSRGFALESGFEEGVSPDGSLAIYGQRYLYLRNNILIIDGANMRSPILAEPLVRRIVDFLNDSGRLVSGFVLQNWILDNDSVGHLFDAIRTRPDTNLLGIDIFGIGVREGASNVMEALSRLIASTNNTLRTIRYRGNSLLHPENDLMVAQSLMQHTILRTLDFSQNNISAKMAEVLRCVVERNRGLEQIYLSRCVFDEAGVLTFHRSCTSPTETVLDFDGITIEENGFRSLASTAVAAESSLIMMQQRNVELKELIFRLLERYPCFWGKVDKEELVSAIFYGSEERILKALHSPARILYDADYALVAAIREVQVNLRNLLGQPDSMAAISSVSPEPSAARIKKRKKPIMVSLTPSNDSSTSSNNSTVVDGSVNQGSPAVPNETANGSGWFSWAFGWMVFKYSSK